MEEDAADAAAANDVPLVIDPVEVDDEFEGDAPEPSTRKRNWAEYLKDQLFYDREARKRRKQQYPLCSCC